LCILVLALASAILAQLFTNYQSNINSKWLWWDSNGHLIHQTVFVGSKDEKW
jgi:peptidoglycan/LPS O-acetylase OafA/YrhL